MDEANATQTAGTEPGQQPLLAAAGIKFSNISGVINTADCDRFKKLIFRISRGI